MTSELLLINPKYAHNLGSAVRAAATLGASAVHWTGRRAEDGMFSRKGKDRLPREERLAEYRHIEYGQVLNNHRVFDDAVARGLTPVAVELGAGTELLPLFEHPEDALYVFGPEDGSLTSVQLAHCHRFVQIPSRSCLNLAGAVYVTLYDRVAKEVRREHHVPAT